MCWHAWCVCVCVCVSVVFCILILLNQAPYLKFHKKIFTTNWSQIWVLFQDLIKYVLSFNTILTQFLEKWNKNYKKNKTKIVWKSNRTIQSMFKLGSYSVYPQCLRFRILYKGNFTMILYGYESRGNKITKAVACWGLGYWVVVKPFVYRQWQLRHATLIERVNNTASIWATHCRLFHKV